MISALFFIIVGFVLLIKGASWLVQGSSSLAKRLGISQLVIGLTVVAFGTSAPELFISIFASINHKADIAIGNILGSNIANIFLVLGISAAMHPLALKRSTIWKEIPFSLLAVIVFALLMNGGIIQGGPFLGLTRIDGLLLIAFFLFFLYYTFTISKTDTDAVGVRVQASSLSRSLVIMIAGLAGLVLGGRWIVSSAVAIASMLGVSESTVALTIVAVGTSLPELATSAIAAYRSNADIAVGNVVGSNIFNILWVLGISSVINPLPFSRILFVDTVVVIIATLLLFIFVFIGKRHTLPRWQGVVFILLYIGYLISLAFR